MKRTKFEKGITLIALTITIVVLIILAAVAIGIIQNDGTVGKNEKVKKDNYQAQTNEKFFKWNGTEIIGYTELGLKQKEIVIPAKCTGFREYGALSENTTVEKISFEKDEMKLEKLLFMDCTSLKEVKLPKNIGDELPKGIFARCSSLESVKMPESLKSIGEGAFNHTAIKRFVVPEGVEIMGEDVFQGCDSLEKIILPNSLEIIERDMFLSCDNLKEVVFPSSLKEIKKDAFKFCKSLKIADFSNTKLEKIGSEAFYECDSLETIKLPVGIKSIELESFVFLASTNIKEVYIPESFEFDWSVISNFLQGNNNIDVYVKKDSSVDKGFSTENKSSRINIKYY